MRSTKRRDEININHQPSAAARVRFPIAIPNSLEFRLARSQEDWEGALGLLHAAYVEMGYMLPEESGLRVTKYHALPTTSVLIGLWKGEIVATLSVVQDSRLGLPMDELFDLSRLRSKGRRIVEVGGLAVKKEFRDATPNLFLLLSNLSFRYSKHYAHADYVTICVNPKDMAFYEQVMSFRRLPPPRSLRYEFANGHPGVGAFLNTRYATKYWRRHSQDLSREKSPFFFYEGFAPPNFCFPKRTFHRVADPTLSPELMEHLFKKRSAVFAKLSQSERRFLWALYSDSAFRRILPEPDAEFPSIQRHPRYPVGLRAWTDQKVVSVRIADVSLGGLRVVTGAQLPVKSRLEFQLEVGDGTQVPVAGRVVWTRHGLGSGIALDAQGDAWADYLAQLKGVWSGGAHGVGE